MKIQGISIGINENSRKSRRNQQEFNEFSSKSARIQGISVEISENFKNFRRNQREFQEFPSKSTRIQGISVEISENSMNPVEIENENSAMGLSIERTAIQYVAASGSIYVQHGSTIALGWFSLHTKWALNGS